MKMLQIVILQSALQQQKSPNLEINEIIDLLMSKFQPKQFTQYLTQQEVANILGIDVRTVRNYTRKGFLLANRFGHRIFYPSQELLRSLISNL